MQKKNDSSNTARHNARHYALQAMYKREMTDASIAEIETEFLEMHVEKKIDLDYFRELIRGIHNNQDELDNAIKPFLSRSMRDIDPVELAVLRLATYELIKRPDIPYRVIINEALELAKKFGSVEGYKFVNGVLDKIAKQIRAAEINMK